MSFAVVSSFASSWWAYSVLFVSPYGASPPTTDIWAHSISVEIHPSIRVSVQSFDMYGTLQYHCCAPSPRPHRISRHPLGGFIPARPRPRPRAQEGDEYDIWVEDMDPDHWDDSEGPARVREMGVKDKDGCFGLSL
jgi:hypothetical protein